MEEKKKKTMLGVKVRQYDMEVRWHEANMVSNSIDSIEVHRA